MSDDLDPQVKAVLDKNREIQETYKSMVRGLGAFLGFGNLMRLAEECWREFTVEQGWPPGGEHSVGPCVAFLVECPCGMRVLPLSSCDWCCGSGRVTKRVKEAMEALDKK